MRLCSSKWVFLIVVSVWIAFPSSAAAQRPRFSIGQPVTVDGGDAGPQGVAVADLNKDGRPDIVTVSTDAEGGPIAVLLNQGGGTFAAPQFIADEESLLTEPVAVAVADVGAVSGGPDQNNDIIVIDADGGYLILFGDGAGNFTIEGDEISTIEGLDTPVAVAIGDFDGRNGPDLAIVDTDSSGDNGEVFFLCNIGQAGVFEPCSTLALDSGGEEPIDMGAGDFNGDGFLDVVVLNQGFNEGEGNVGLITGNGQGTFEIPRSSPFAIANEPRDFAVGSLNPNDDSIDDVAVAEFETLSDDNVTILLGGTGGAIFTRPDKALLELGTTALAIGNFAGDQNVDLAGANDPGQATSIITVASGNGAGDFADPQQGGTLGGGAVSYGVGRLNDDDFDDLVVLSLDGSTLRIALSNPIVGTETPGTPAPGSPSMTPTPTPTRVITPELEGCEVPLTSASGRVELVAAAQADLDRDGSPDIVVADRVGSQVFVMLTDPGDLRGPDAPCDVPNTTAYSVGAGPRSVAIQDLNGDSRPDLAVATSAGVTLLLATGSEGSFALLRTFATGADPRSIAVEDFDHDGVQDLAVANHGSNNVIILFGIPGSDTQFGERTSRPPFSVAGALIVVAADLNGDGWADLGVAGDTNNNVSFFLQTPNSPGVFPGTPPNAVTLTGGTPTAMIAAQTTSSPARQLIVLTRSATGEGNFVVMRRAGNVFSQGALVPTGGRPTAIGTGPFVGGSGPTDFLVASSSDDTVGFFPGNSDGSFGTSTSTSETGRSPAALVSGDFDGDGKFDVAVANMGSGTVTMLLSSRVPPTPSPTVTNTVGPSNTPTMTGTPGPSSTPTRGTPGPTETPKEGAFSLSSCSVVSPGRARSGDGTLLFAGAALTFWLRRRQAKKQ